MIISCACRCTCVWVHRHMHGHVYGGQRFTGVSFLRSHTPCFVKPSFSLGSGVLWLGYAHCPVSSMILSVSASKCGAAGLYFLSGLTGLLCLSGVTGLHSLSGVTDLHCLSGVTGLLCLSGLQVCTACLPFKLVLWMELKPSSYDESLSPYPLNSIFFHTNL